MMPSFRVLEPARKSCWASARWLACALVLLALLTGGCGRRDAPGKAQRVVDRPRPGDPPLCSADVPALESGRFEVAAGADRWNGLVGFEVLREGDCARLHMMLDADTGRGQVPGDSSASPGSAGSPGSAEGSVLRGEFLRSYGVVRIELPATMNRLATSDTLLGAPLSRLLTAAYVVRLADGRLVLDAHPATAALARLRVLAAPSRLALDLAPGGGAIPQPAPRGGEVVLLEPRPGAVAYPLHLRGYVAPGAAEEWTARLFDAQQPGRELARTTWRVPRDATGAWRGFEAAFASGPSGSVLLRLDPSAEVPADAGAPDREAVMPAPGAPRAAGVLVPVRLR